MRSGTSEEVRRRCRTNFSRLALATADVANEDSWQTRLTRRTGELFDRAGIETSGQHAWLVAVGILLASSVLGLLNGIGSAMAMLSGGTIMYIGYLRYQFRQRAAAVFVQLPSFIDSLDRSLSSGHSLQKALGLATERAQEPLHGVMQRVYSNVELGGNLGEQLKKAADTMQVKEFQLMALAVDVNQRYGGSIKALLNSITVMVRQREQARREFAALTGETRFSAWVLGILPIAVAAYMAVINPGYIESMWVSDDGRNILYLALGFQAAGSLILWKMIKSI